MRQGQQNRRGRGRGRKPQNSLSRNLESNGPDVKIRGTASHIAEKYTTLARDAQVAGNSVAGESYLQHAEHYNRIIMANQAQQQAASSAQSEGMNGSGGDRQNASAEGDGNAQPEAAAPAEAATDDKTASDSKADDKPARKAPASSDKPRTPRDAKTKTKTEAIGDDEGLARMMARSSAKKPGNGAAEENQAEAADASQTDASTEETVSDDAGADEASDEAVT